jgi:hypothetical protein
MSENKIIDQSTNKMLGVISWGRNMPAKGNMIIVNDVLYEITQIAFNTYGPFKGTINIRNIVIYVKETKEETMLIDSQI